MVTIIILACITALTVIFIWSCFQEGMILEKLPQLLYWLPDWLQKPLFICPVCMTFWYGSLLVYFVAISKNIDFVSSVLVVLTACGLNVFLSPIAHDLHGLDDE